tara:strand:- start:143 stop:385 length:243 start_codon:yes stop_codon:yes gene_type:complete
MKTVNTGESFRLSFNIDGNVVPTTATFTGTVITIDGVRIYCCILASGKEYGFTQKQLDGFAQWNDESLREQVDSFTMGAA